MAGLVRCDTLHQRLNGPLRTQDDVQTFTRSNILLKNLLQPQTSNHR